MVMASAVSPSPFVIPPTVCSVHVSPVATFSRLSAGPSSLRRLAFAASISDLHFTAFVAETSRSGCSVGRSAGSIVSMAKRSVGDLTRDDLKGKKVFLRADLNVPLDDDHNVIDDTRIRASLPTIRHLIENGSKVILASHLGRPKGVTPKLSLAPVVPRLSELLGIEVKKADDCIGPVVQNLVDGLSEGSVLLLENVRFYKEEEKNEGRFAKKLASLADVYVNDAFGCVHRAHASTEGITKFLKPCVSGFLLQKELDYLADAVSNPKRPLTAVIGGSKVSTKIGVIESLLKKCDLLILGGGMVYTFYRALEISVGTSVVEEGKVGFAKSLLHKAKDKGIPILLPTDFVVADRFSPDADTKIVGAHSIPDDWMGLDIGPESIDMFCGALESSQTVIWNGPMGVFEYEKFAAGTQSIARKLAEITSRGATTIVGGGESVAALRKSGVAASITHVSTGGGASLELLEGKKIPGLLALDDRV